MNHTIVDLKAYFPPFFFILLFFAFCILHGETVVDEMATNVVANIQIDVMKPIHFSPWALGSILLSIISAD
jgi:hypothetical protein